MSKFMKIRKELKKASIIVVKKDEKNTIPINGTLTRSFYIAPKIGLYDTEDLQKFMMSLFPDIKEDEKQDCKERLFNGNYLFGYLVFKEKIGRVIGWNEFIFSTPVVRIKNKQKFRLNGVKRDLTLKTVVRMFPDKKIAEFIIKNKGGGISFDELMKHKMHPWPCIDGLRK